MKHSGSTSFSKIPSNLDLTFIREIKELASLDYQHPVISLYFNLDPEKVAPWQKGVTRSFRSLKSRALEERAEFVEKLSRENQEVLDHDLQAIEEYLTERLTAGGFRSIIIFKSENALNHVIALPVHTQDRLKIDSDPYLLPLEALLEETERILFLEVTKEESRFMIYQLGYCEDADKLSSFVPTDTVDKSIPGKVQRHRLMHLQWHLESTAQRAYRLCSQQACDALIVMAEERVSHLLEEFLHETLRGKIIGRIYGSPVADQRDRRQIIDQVAREHQAVREAAAVEEFSQYKPGAERVSGLPQVINALNLFLAHRLLLDETLRQPGVFCKERHFLSLAGTECPFCGRKLLSAENVADEIVETARLHGVKVRLVECRPELMTEYDRIAAAVYTNPSAASE
jgi:hypothetical protein